MRGLVLAVSVPFLAGVVFVALFIAANLLSVSTVWIVNTGNRTLNVAVDAAHSPVGMARLAPGEGMYRVFLAPPTDGEIGVACRAEHSDKTLYQSSGYITGGMTQRYVVEVPSCEAPLSVVQQ